MEHLPLYIIIGMIATTFVTLFFFYKAAANSKTVLFMALAWLGLQAAIGLAGFYTVTHTIPPRFALTILPPIAAITICFVTKKGKAFLDGLDMKWLTLLHVVRIPVEMVLLWLFFQKYVPQLMTFEGRNFDIVSGLTAPFIFYFGFVKKKMSRTLILVWNFICLLLLINIVATAILSAPSNFQKTSFDQPNIAVLYFPFVWLPCFIVPVVLLSHLATIRHLLYYGDKALHRPTINSSLSFTAPEQVKL